MPLAERILFLRRDVEMTAADPVEMLAKAASMEQQSARDYLALQSFGQIAESSREAD